MRLKGKTALVTGAAQGFGFGIAEIVLGRRNAEDLARVEEAGDDAAAVTEDFDDAQDARHDLEDMRRRIAFAADRRATLERFERLLAEEAQQARLGAIIRDDREPGRLSGHRICNKHDSVLHLRLMKGRKATADGKETVRMLAYV